MKHLKVNYLSCWDDEGYHYRQTIYIDKKIKNLFNKRIINEPKTIDNIMYLKELSNKKVQYLKLTQVRFLLRLLNELDYDTKRFLLDRNTKIIIE